MNIKLSFVASAVYSKDSLQSTRRHSTNSTSAQRASSVAGHRSRPSCCTTRGGGSASLRSAVTLAFEEATADDDNPLTLLVSTLSMVSTTVEFVVLVAVVCVCTPLPPSFAARFFSAGPDFAGLCRPNFPVPLSRKQGDPWACSFMSEVKDAVVIAPAAAVDTSVVVMGSAIAGDEAEPTMTLRAGRRGAHFRSSLSACWEVVSSPLFPASCLCLWPARI